MYNVDASAYIVCTAKDATVTLSNGDPSVGIGKSSEEIIFSHTDVINLDDLRALSNTQKRLFDVALRYFHLSLSLEGIKGESCSKSKDGKTMISDTECRFETTTPRPHSRLAADERSPVA